MKYLISVVLLCTIVTFSTAQPHKNNWYFGNGAGIEFSGGLPLAISSNLMYADEGSATVSDHLGNLLFYTNGQVVYNSNHTIMPNGSGLGSTIWTCQPAVIVPLPGSATLYYLITITNWVPTTDYIKYSIIDMSLDGGLGDVTATKAVVLDSNYREQLTVAPHANGTDFWIISHKATTNEFASFLLTANGISTTPVISPTGMIYSGNNRFGALRVSHDCTKLVTVLGSAYTCNEVVQLFKFDNTNGQVFNPITLATHPTLDGAYSAEFSPDNSKLYVTEYNGNDIMQFDLTVSNIQNSMTNIANGSGTKSGLQLGPDGKIYVGKAYSSYLGVIEYPNLPGVNCNYVNNSISLGTGNNCSIALPNFYDYSCNFQTALLNPKKVSISVFPNPTTNVINIHFEQNLMIDKIEIIDVLGRKVLTDLSYRNQSTPPILIDVSSLPAGLYNCSIRFENIELNQPISILKH